MKQITLVLVTLMLVAACSSSPTESTGAAADDSPVPAASSAEEAQPTTTSAGSTTSPSPTPAPVDYFVTLGPGQTLPSGETCGQLVRPVAETVAENAPYNDTEGVPVIGATYLSRQLDAEHLEARIDGAFRGTTDEVIQWAACKWGFDEDLVRAQAYTESRWFAGWLGDCGVEAQPDTGGVGGCGATGLMQVRSADIDTFHPGTWPHAWRSTAFNLDYSLAVMRACFEGLEPWLADFAPNGDAYEAGDHLGCMGRWFSGQWRDEGALAYLDTLAANLDGRFWEGEFVGCADWEASFYCSGIDR